MTVLPEDRPIVKALRGMLTEMDDSTPILRDWRHKIQVAINVIRSLRDSPTPEPPTMRTLLMRAARLLRELGDECGLPPLDSTRAIQIEAEALVMEIENVLAD